MTNLLIVFQFPLSCFILTLWLKIQPHHYETFRCRATLILSLVFWAVTIKVQGYLCGETRCDGIQLPLIQCIRVELMGVFKLRQPKSAQSAVETWVGAALQSRSTLFLERMRLWMKQIKVFLVGFGWRRKAIELLSILIWCVRGSKLPRVHWRFNENLLVREGSFSNMWGCSVCMFVYTSARFECYLREAYN